MPKRTYAKTGTVTLFIRSMPSLEAELLKAGAGGRDLPLGEYVSRLVQFTRDARELSRRNGYHELRRLVDQYGLSEKVI